jgi:ubiquinone/menaquinone biosynthesis C-methylase UbiE
MSYEGDLAHIQRALSQTHDLIVRRAGTLRVLNLRAGERVLELGCGGGYLAYEAARFVGPQGHVSAIDISPEQVAAAARLCAEFDWVACVVADAADLPFDDHTFDAVFCNQVLEYVPDLSAALSEINRVLVPGGRVVAVATNWHSLVWHSAEPARMERVLDAWTQHTDYPDLPAVLAPKLRGAGLHTLHQISLPILNTSYHPSSFAYWGARLIHAYVKQRRLISPADADAWLAEFDDLEQAGAFFLSSTPILTEAIKPA